MIDDRDRLTGERWEAYAGLVFLRARYYEPGTGRFVRKDPWSGGILRPSTHNGFTYARNNPLRFLDLLGLCEYDPYHPTLYNDCLTFAVRVAELTGEPLDELSKLPYDWLRDAFNQLRRSSFDYFLDLHSTNAGAQGLDALIHYFEVYPGSAYQALMSVLAQTAGFGGINVPISIQAQFGKNIPPGASLCDAYNDEKLYADPKTWGSLRLGTSYQLSHFLTAVSMAYYNCDSDRLSFMTELYGRLLSVQPINASSDPEDIALRMIVGHELVSDKASRSFFQQYQAATGSMIDSFREAIEADLAGDSGGRDDLLESFLQFDPDPSMPSSQSQRVGNSMEDLLLSLKGWEFGCAIKRGVISVGQTAAAWLTDNLIASCW